jgi:hypothetical protein
MSSTIISFPNINRFINFKGKYLLPNIDTQNSSYFILTNTTDKYLLTNNDINNKKIEIEVFAVGGGGAGGYFNGNGGDGGTVIYKKLEIEREEILELKVGKGAYYINDNRYINGFKLILYEGGINNIFSSKNNYIMNMKEEDIIIFGLIKKIEKNISEITNLKKYIETDINSIVINNPILTDICSENPLKDECNNIKNNWFNFGRGYTLEITSYFFVPYDCSIEIKLEAYKYAILFFYNDDDIKKNLFKKDLNYYNSDSKYNAYWKHIENGNVIFKRDGLKENERFYIKIIHSQTGEISNNQNNLKIDIKLTNNDKDEYIIDDRYFKFNNNDNYGIIYSTPTTITNKEIIINADGGTSGYSNPTNRNFGNGGCNTNIINNKKIKICKQDGNGSTGIKLPTSISNELQDLSYKSYRYGSGGGGANWKANGYGGKAGIDGGNGISFTNIPSLSMPTPNSGGGGGGNSLITNITERMLKISKLSGADGIIIIKIKKKTEQTLIQTFANMDKMEELVNINAKLELLYNTDNINIYNKDKFIDNLKLTIEQIYNFVLTSAKLYILFSILLNNMKIYMDLTEKEKLLYPIKFVFNQSKGVFFVENGYYNFNFANYNEVNFYFSIIRPSIEVKNELSKLFSNNNEIKYNNNTQLKDEYKIINDILNPANLVLFIENVNKNYFNYFKYIINFIFFTIIYNLILESSSNKDIYINKIKELVNIIKNFNNNYFSPIDKNSNEETDTLIKDRTLYIEQQKEYKKIYDKNLEEIDKSNQITNYSIHIFKNKYNQNKKNNWFDTIFYITIVIIIISFIITYNYFEDSNKSLIILVLFIIMLIIIITLWNNAINDLKIFEKFGCKDTISTNNCIDIKGNSINNNTIYPYYYITKGDSITKIKANNDIIADIFVYSTPFNIKIDGIDRYYEPNIDIYKNVLLPKSYSYNIYNNKIIISSPDNIDSTLIQEKIRNNESINNELRIFNCKGERSDICNNYDTILLSNKYTRYNNKGDIIKEINTQPQIEDNDIRSYFNFFPDNTNIYNKYGMSYISENVIQEPFIIVKVINDMDLSNETLEENIHNFRKEMNTFNINVNLYLLNKNTKKIIDFTSNYQLDTQYKFRSAMDTNEHTYDRNIQAYNIISREIIVKFYIKLLICLIIIISLFCIFLYQYNKNSFSKILLLGLLLLGIAMYLILYNIFKHNRLDHTKYYFL